MSIGIANSTNSAWMAILQNTGLSFGAVVGGNQYPATGRPTFMNSQGATLADINGFVGASFPTYSCVATRGSYTSNIIQAIAYAHSGGSNTSASLVTANMSSQFGIVSGNYQLTIYMTCSGNADASGNGTGTPENNTIVYNWYNIVLYGSMTPATMGVPNSSFMIINIPGVGQCAWVVPSSPSLIVAAQQPDNNWIGQFSVSGLAYTYQQPVSSSDTEMNLMCDKIRQKYNPIHLYRDGSDFEVCLIDPNDGLKKVYHVNLDDLSIALKDTMDNLCKAALNNLEVAKTIHKGG